MHAHRDEHRAYSIRRIPATLRNNFIGVPDRGAAGGSRPPLDLGN